MGVYRVSGARVPWSQDQRDQVADLLARGVRAAEYRQLCQVCPEPIRAGDLIARATAGWAHLECVPPATVQRSAAGRRFERRLAARKGR